MANPFSLNIEEKKPMTALGILHTVPTTPQSTALTGAGIAPAQLAPTKIAQAVIDTVKTAAIKSAQAPDVIAQHASDTLVTSLEKSTGKPISEEQKIKITDMMKFGVTGAFGVAGAADIKAITSKDVITNFLRKIDSSDVKAVRKPLGMIFSDLYEKIFDRFNPIIKVLRSAEKTGEKILPGENPEFLIRRYLGNKGIAESKLAWKTTMLTSDGNLHITGDGLKTTIEPVKEHLDDLRALLVAEREIELSERKITKGIVSGEAEQVIKALKQKHGNFYEKLNAAAKGSRDYAKRAILDPLHQVGAISQDAYNAILKSNKFYTPFQRVMEGIEANGTVEGTRGLFEIVSSPVKQIKGSKKIIIDPLETLIQNTYKVTDFVERARTARSIIQVGKIAAATGETLSGVFTKVPARMVPVAQVEGQTIFRPSFFNPAPDTVAILENGKRVFYKVPADLANIMTQMSEGETSILIKILSFPARTLRAGATLAPEFVGRNPLRDQFSAMTQAKYGFIPGVDLVKGLWETIGNTELYNKWLASGGGQATLVAMDRASSQETLKQILATTVKEKISAKGLNILNPLEALRFLSETGEQATRLGVYKKAIAKGASDIEASFESREATLDFARRGSQTKSVNQIIAFSNAKLQGIDRIVRAFAQRPIQTSALMVGGITTPSIALYLLNRSNPRYQEVPRWQKDLFWIVMTKDHIIRIPKPFEPGMVFGSVPERILEWIDKNDPITLQTIASELGSVVGVSDMIPNAILSIIENTANYSFFRERPIVAQSVQGLPAEMQANQFTSETAKQIGQYIKKSPAKIENIFLGYTGGLGKYALSISDQIMTKIGITNPPSLPEKTIADLPFIKGFIVRSPAGSQSESVNRFYDLLTRVEALEKGSRQIAESGNIKEAVEFMKENKSILLAKGLRRTAQDIAQIRNQQKFIFESRILDPKRKREQLDRMDSLITQLAVQALQISSEIE